MTTALHWLNDVSANFSTAADWTSNTPPGPTNDAIIDAAGTKAYTVTSNAGVTVNSLSLAATATLLLSSSSSFTALFGTTGSVTPEANAGVISIGNGSTFAIGGNFDNANKITLNSSGTATNFEIAGPVALSGGGLLTLSNNASNFIVSNNSPQTFTNVDNTISGAGTIGDANLTLINDQSGVIKATGSHALVLNTVANTIVNLGTLEDTGAGGLQIRGTVNNATTGNTVGGVIEAVGASARVDLNGADIIGGTLITESGGQIDTVTGTYSNELDGQSGVGSSLANAGKLVVVNNSGLVIQGNIHNTGTINLAGTGVSPQKTQLIVTGSGAQLDGGGTVVMSNNATNAIITNGASATLTNGETISGAGTIGFGNQLTLDNNGLINATGSIALVLKTGNNAVENDGDIETTGAGGLAVDSNVTNDGTLAAVGTGGMVLSGTVTGGVVIAQNAGSHVDLGGGTISSGSIVTIRTGAKLDTLTANTGTVDANVDNAGTVLVANNSTLIESGTITNTGTFALSGTTAATVLSLDGDLTFQGGGHLTLSNSAVNAITASTSAILENVDNTISGAGTIGIGNANLTLQNDLGGVINANGTVALTINTSTNDIGNDGLLELTGSGGLVLDSSLTNQGTVLSAGSKQLVINSGLNNNALVETTKSGGLAITGSTGNTNAGAIKALGTGALLIAGTVDNTGGTIDALASGSSIRMQTGTISDGLIVIAAGASLAPLAGTINTIGVATTVDNAGSIVLANGATLVLNEDTVNNYGATTLNASSLATKLEIEDNTTLQGGGQLVLTNSTLNSIVSDGSDPGTLTNVNNVISGAGTIGDANLTFVNDGSVLANKASALTFAGAVTNTGGTIKTTGTGGIVFAATSAVTNSGGTIAADGSGGLVVKATITGGAVAAQISGAHIDLSNGTLEHATVSTVAGSTINALKLTSDSLHDVTVNNLGTIAIADNATLLADGLFDNVGKITLNSTNDPTQLEIGVGDLTLTGGGLVVLTNNVNNSIVSDGIDLGTLTNVNNTISGAGTIGDGNLTLVNGGTINANGTHALTLNTGSNHITNAGKISETGTGGLTIESDVVNGGTVTASGTGALLVQGSAVITGGIISTLGAGSHIDLSNGRLEDAYVSTAAKSMIDTVAGTMTNEIGGPVTNAGSIVVNDNSELTLDGSINNTGTISLSASADPTTLKVADDLVLTGHGRVTLSNNINNSIVSVGPGNAATTTVKVGGQVSAGDTVSLTFTNPTFGSPETVDYVVQGGDTATTIATGLVSLINADAGVHHITADNSSGASPTIITINEPGFVANATVVSGSVAGSLTATIAGTQQTGDVITLNFANSGLGNLPESVSYTVLNTDTSTTIATALKNAINADTKLTADDITATSSSGVVTVDETGLVGTATTVSATVSGSLSATIGGTAVAGDTVSLTFANAALGGSPVTVSYLVQGGDGTANIASGLKTAINTNTALQTAGITAASSTAVVTISDSGATHDPTVVSESISGTVTATISGTVTNTDQLTLTFTNAALFGSPEVVTYTVGTHPDSTTMDLATDLADAINGDATLTTAGITATASTSNVIITETNLNGSTTVVSESTSGGATETIALSDSGNLPGETVALSNGGDVTTDTASVSSPGQLTGETLGLVNSGDLSGGGNLITNVDNTISGAGTIGDGTMTLTNSVNGIIDANGTVALTIDAGVLINSGLIESTSTGGLTLDSGNVVINNGTFDAAAGLIDAESTVTGTGTAEINGSGQIKFAGADTNQNVTFGSGASGELILARSQTFTGNISGFVLGDSIDLKDINFADIQPLAYNSSSDVGGTLVVTDGTNTADLTLLGSYALANFHVATDGGTGTLITDPPVDQTNHTIASGATVTIGGPAMGTDTFAGKSGTLVLDLATEFAGKISGFGGKDAIDLANIGFGANSTLGYNATGSNTGTLTVSDGTHTANIALLGSYMASSFATASDGHGGTLITEAATVAQNQLTQPHA